MDYKELARQIERISDEDPAVISEWAEVIKTKHLKKAATAITALLARAEAAEAENIQLKEAVDFARAKDAEILRLGKEMRDAESRAEKAERESKEAINYMRRMFGWCTGCVHFTGNYGISCKVGKMCDCSGEDDGYKFCGEEE